VDTNSLKRGRNGRLRTGVDYPRRPFKEEVMGSNPIRATEFIPEGRTGVWSRAETVGRDGKSRPGLQRSSADSRP